MLIMTGIPLDGTRSAFTADTSTPAVLAVGEEPDRFATLVNLYQSNEILLAELRLIDRKMIGTRDYLASVGNNPALGQAHLQRLRTRRSAVLTFLRANRLQARQFLADHEHVAFSA